MDDWQDSDDAAAMLQAVRRTCGERKLRLLACACARSRWVGLVEQEYQRAVEVAERYADGAAAPSELRAAGEDTWALGWGGSQGDADANAAAEASIEDFAGDAARQAVLRMGPAGPALVREILGDPFRPRADRGSWSRDRRVAALARELYDQRRFGELPRLAELLDGLGCQDRALLDHLRSPAPHFRGCWALDALLGQDPGQDLLTEAQWQAETRPFALLVWWRYHRGEPSPRKRRLLACACCRLTWPLFREEGLRQAIETAEALADGRATEAELAPLRAQAHALGRSRGEVLSHTLPASPDWASRRDAWRSAYAASVAAGPDDGDFSDAVHALAQDGGRGRDTEDAGQAALVREILGDPLRQTPFDPAWRTPDVLALARSVHQRQAFDQMPILCDALRDAGCDDPDLLGHCSQGPHARGCWLIDQILGQE